MKNNLELLINYVFQLMPESSNEEFRLTTYLLSLFLFTNQKHCWIYFDELINGRDKFLGSGRKEKYLRGLGLNKDSLEIAIKKVNRRGLIGIEADSSSNYLLKITLKTNPTKFNYAEYL